MITDDQARCEEIERRLNEPLSDFSKLAYCDDDLRLRAKIAELRLLDAERRTYPHVGIAGVMRLDQALQIGDFLANEVERLAAENERLKAEIEQWRESSERLVAMSVCMTQKQPIGSENVP